MSDALMSFLLWPNLWLRVAIGMTAGLALGHAQNPDSVHPWALVVMAMIAFALSMARLSDD